jgi:hypothetical protein
MNGARQDGFRCQCSSCVQNETRRCHDSAALWRADQSRDRQEGGGPRHRRDDQTKLECVLRLGRQPERISRLSEKQDNCQYASIGVSQHKAHTAARCRRPTLVFETLIGKGPYFAPADFVSTSIRSEHKNDACTCDLADIVRCPWTGTKCQSGHNECYDTVLDDFGLDTVASHRLYDRPFLPKKSRRLLYVQCVYLDTAGPPSTVVRYLKEEGVANRLPIAVTRRSFLSHPVSPLICVEREQIAYSIWIFVRRDCDAEDIRVQCCKHLTVGTGLLFIRRSLELNRAITAGTFAVGATGLVSPWSPHRGRPASASRLAPRRSAG